MNGLPQAEERRIIQKILKGDSKSFEFILEKYKKLVFHIAFRMINNVEDAEDIAQEVFLKVHKNLSNFRFESKFSTWIAKITHNSCINYLQKKKVQLIDDLNEPEGINIHQNSDDSPYHSTESLDTSKRIQDEISKLPPRYRTILILYHSEGMSYQDIGEVMQLPEGTVKSYLFRARRYLKKAIMKKYQPEELSWNST
jgi:RNA polymerase sigma-70 factor (ECF subfamily)